jgi:protoheme IX farnesyltransferase
VLNQVIEVNVDRLMDRTKGRPLPAGRMTRTSALGLGIIMGSVGLLHLAYNVNLVAAYLAAATLLIYLAFYTPMKRRTSLCVTIGAVSGAIPPVIGWTAVDGTVGVGAWVLFGILFTWQMPHFLAIAWMYRDEYAQAGFAMLWRKDTSGIYTAIQALFFSIVLTAVTLVPFFRQEADFVYLIGALVANSLLLVTSVRFVTSRTRLEARRMFFASIIYLPLILCLMVFTR